MDQYDIKIAAIQETKLHENSKLGTIHNFSLIREDRKSDKGGGVAFLIHDSLPFKRIPSPASIKSDPHIEEISIAIKSKNSTDLTIRNIYIPPASSCKTPNWKPDFKSLSDQLPEPFLILGDFNSHHSSIFSQDKDDERGTKVIEWVADENLGILNEDKPTRPTSSSTTAPDLTVASPSIMTACTWSTLTAINSDHLPIHVNISSGVKFIKAPNRTFINFKKADWNSFQDYIENQIDPEQEFSNPQQAEKFLRNVINTAAKIYIPSGRIPKLANSIPTEAAHLIKSRDEVRELNPADPRIQELNYEINKIIANHKKEKWLAHLANCEPNGKRLWDTIKSLDAPPKPPPNQSLSFNNVIFDNPKKIVNQLNRQYTPGNTALQGIKPDQGFRNLMRNLQKKPAAEPTVIFSASQVLETLKGTKNSKAVGPDGISPIMLKHLGPKALNFITILFNNVIKTAVVPPLWKTGRIIPLLKPGKPSNEGKSYRPVSLLSPLAKLLEALILPHVQQAVVLAEHQHGFRKGRSCTTALQDITSHIKKGLNREKPVHRTVLVAVDLSCAFDTVSHETLIKDVSKLQLDPYLKRFIAGYLRGRKTYVEFRNVTSKCRQMRQGVPQGGVLSPTLFNLYMASMPTPPPEVKVTSYADDTSLMSSGPKIEPLCKSLNSYLGKLNAFFKERNLAISAPKSSATIFTTASQEVNTKLDIQIDGKQVPTVKNPKILGTFLDPLLTFGPHTKYVRDKVTKRNNILRALAGTSWGKDKDTLNMTYKAIGKSCIYYCAPIYTPTLSDTNWIELQRTQNAALRTVLGCTKTTDIGHLHSESKNMMVKEHNAMLSKQFLLATKMTGHPNFSIPYTKPDRIMKEDLQSKFEDEIQHLFKEDGNSKADHKLGLLNIHTEEVAKAIDNIPPNKVLGQKAPEISSEEKTLPRGTRSTLSQLRSGYSSYLKSYLNRINPQKYSPNCPDCNFVCHDTMHLFDCPSKPTDLTVNSLWTTPVTAATFLGLQTKDSSEDDDGRRGDPG